MMLLPTAGCGSVDRRGNGVVARDSSDAATRAYLQADETLVRDLRGHPVPGRRKMVRLGAMVNERCGTGLSEALGEIASGPRPEETHRQFLVRVGRGLLVVQERLILALEAARRQGQRRFIQRFAAVVLALRWQDPRITAVVHAFVRIELQRLEVRLPDTCRTVRRWDTGAARIRPPARAFTEFRTWLPEVRGRLRRSWHHASSAVGCSVLLMPTRHSILRVLARYGAQRSEPSVRMVEAVEASLRMAQTSLLDRVVRDIDRNFDASLSVPPNPPIVCASAPNG